MAVRITISCLSKGHHPCAALYGFDMYYLNVMAGPPQMAVQGGPGYGVDHGRRGMRHMSETGHGPRMSNVVTLREVASRAAFHSRCFPDFHARRIGVPENTREG